MFDRWRKNYDEATDEQQREFYSRMFREYPKQESYHLTSVIRFIEAIRDPYVFEFGGWDGQLAAETLYFCPNVEEWTNFDCCHQAVTSTAQRDHRYHPMPCEFNVWDTTREHFNTLVAAHSIEHIRQEQFHKLIDSLPDLEYVYIDSPLSAKTQNWHGYEGTHIYEAGWDKTIADLAERGFVRVARWRTGTNMEQSTAYAFRRKLA